MSLGLAILATAACTVRALSAAEMPVVTPSAASMETVKLVPMRAPFFCTIFVRFNCRQRASVSVKQISPRPYLAIKLMCSAVTKSAASTKSPSFSRFSSSTNTTMRPCLISAIISWALLMVTLLFPMALLSAQVCCLRINYSLAHCAMRST